MKIESLKLLDKKALEAYFICKKIIKKRILPQMNLVIGEYTFGEEKINILFHSRR